MRVGVIGAGFAGLAASYYLTKKGHKVTIFERDKNPGGLAIGYKEKEWDWTLEEHYHHWFTNDKSVLDLAKETGYKVEIHRPRTSSYIDGGIFQLDSATSLLSLSKLSLIDRIRTGASLASLRYNPLWQPLENFRAEPYLRLTMGNKAYEKIWQPLMDNKLGKYAGDVSLAWFWARIYKRTPSLAYPEGGFLKFAKHLEKIIKDNGGKFNYETEVKEVKKESSSVLIKTENQTHKFDAVICTLPSFLFQKITPQLPTSYTDKLQGFKGIGAMNLVLRLKKPFFKDGTYWLNMCDKKSPILAVVEHTNFIDGKHYNNEHILYLGNYLPATDKLFSYTPEKLLKLYHPWLKKINSDYDKSIIGYRLFKAPFAQPIITPKYSKRVPSMRTPIEDVYLANIEQVYPWDRGTNYAVELGEKVASIITS